MTPEARAKAIAEICGWEWDETDGEMVWSDVFGEIVTITWPSLDAIHLAEKKLNFDQLHMTYAGLLSAIVQRHWIEAVKIGAHPFSQTPVHAEPHQREEAFLRTLDKWEDS